MSIRKKIVDALTLIVLLTGCTVSYSSPPEGSGSASTQSHSSTSPAEATMNAIRAAFFTQTAQAHQQNAGTPSLPTANNPGFATVAPTNTGSTAAATRATPASGTPSATNPTIPTATPGKPSTYTVHEGETAWCLARRFNVDPSELLDINAKPNNYLLMPGDILKIPTSAKTFPGDRALHTHSPNMTFTIPANLTNVYYVACWFGDVDPNAIIAANNLKEPYTLTPGKTVIIP